MKILLDTNILILAAINNLPQQAYDLIQELSNELYYSPASIWEIGVKYHFKRDVFNINPTHLLQRLRIAGYNELPISSKHMLLANNLPWIHKDPHDRIMIAQSFIEELPFITTDKLLTQYSDSVLYIEK